MPRNQIKHSNTLLPYHPVLAIPLIEGLAEAINDFDDIVDICDPLAVLLVVAYVHGILLFVICNRWVLL
jgi:hypothetical protein